MNSQQPVLQISGITKHYGGVKALTDAHFTLNPGEHAAIVTILNDSFLEDLGSTNGTTVNGHPIKKHFLQNNDVVEIGKYKLKYINERASQAAGADFEKTMVLRPQAAGVVQVGEAIHALDQNTQQNAALVEETMAAAGALRQQADALQDEIGNFRVA